jgi:hypothetical protein
MRLFTALNKKEEAIKEVYSWIAPERFWKPKEKSWYVSYGTFFIVIIALFALLGEYIAIIAVLAFLFLWFVQGSIPPENAVFKITGLSFYAYGRKYKWKDIKYFWFSETKEALFLNLEIIRSQILEEGRLHRVSILLPDEKIREDVFYTLIKFLDYGEKEEVSYNFLNKMIHGNYVDVNKFLPDEGISEEDAAEIEEFETKFSDLTPNEITTDEKKEAIAIARRKIKKA